MADIKYESGFGASISDLKTGYLKEPQEDKPSYSMKNYRERWVTPDGGWFDEKLYSFTDKERETQGFLTRPWLPTER